MWALDVSRKPSPSTPPPSIRPVRRWSVRCLGCDSLGVHLRQSGTQLRRSEVRLEIKLSRFRPSFIHLPWLLLRELKLTRYEPPIIDSERQVPTAWASRSIARAPQSIAVAYQSVAQELSPLGQKTESGTTSIEDEARSGKH
ncbi:hypothetical protein U1Q18_039481 [Sarracenia purpurea var. burkii]